MQLCSLTSGSQAKFQHGSTTGKAILYINCFRSILFKGLLKLCERANWVRSGSWSGQGLDQPITKLEIVIKTSRVN